jgi:hypothetical protein
MMTAQQKSYIGKRSIAGYLTGSDNHGWYIQIQFDDEEGKKVRRKKYGMFASQVEAIHNIQTLVRCLNEAEKGNQAAKLALSTNWSR